MSETLNDLLVACKNNKCATIKQKKFSNQTLTNLFKSSLLFSKVSFLDFKFNNTNFLQSRFACCTFENCIFDTTFFVDSTFWSCKFQNCIILNSDLTSTEFDKSAFINCEFIDNDFKYSSIEQCNFVTSKFINNNLEQMLLFQTRMWKFDDFIQFTEIKDEFINAPGSRHNLNHLVQKFFNN